MEKLPPELFLAIIPFCSLQDGYQILKTCKKYSSSEIRREIGVRKCPLLTEVGGKQNFIENKLLEDSWISNWTKIPHCVMTDKTRAYSASIISSLKKTKNNENVKDKKITANIIINELQNCI